MRRKNLTTAAVFVALATSVLFVYERTADQLGDRWRVGPILAMMLLLFIGVSELSSCATGRRWQACLPLLFLPLGHWLRPRFPWGPAILVAVSLWMAGFAASHHR